MIYVLCSLTGLTFGATLGRIVIFRDRGFPAYWSTWWSFCAFIAAIVASAIR